MTGAAGRDEAELRELALLHVRAGLRPVDEVEAAMVSAIEVQLPSTDPHVMACAWVLAARRQLATLAATWPTPSDHDRLTAAFAECRDHQVAVLEGVDDLQQVRAVVEGSRTPLRGVLWFSEADVWHAIGHGVLEAGLRHGTGLPAGPQEGLTTAVLGSLERHGIDARWFEGRLQLRVSWQRRPAS